MTAMQAEKIQPLKTQLSAPYFDGCAEGELRAQYCRSCDRYQFYPRTICSHCGTGEPEWQPVSGRGRVASFTVVRHAISAAYKAPYIVALIDLVEGPRMMSVIADAEPGAVAVGANVRVRFENWGGDCVLPVFVLDESE